MSLSQALNQFAQNLGRYHSIAAKGSAQTAMWQVNIVAVGSSVTVWLCLK